MKNTVKRKPLSNKEHLIVQSHFGENKVVDLILATGARISEVKRLFDSYKPGVDYLDIKTKKSDGTNRIYLSKKAQLILKGSESFKDKSVRTLQREVEKLSDALKIPFTAHNLRATFATQLMSMGVDIVSVQHLMNHSDISITAQYIRFDENKLRTSLSLLDENNTLEGMTNHELMQEVVRLRTKLRRYDGK